MLVLQSIIMSSIKTTPIVSETSRPSFSLQVDDEDDLDAKDPTDDDDDDEEDEDEDEA